VSGQHFCPHCGYNLHADEAVVHGDWLLRPDFASHKGEPVGLTRYEASILYTIAAAKGRPVAVDTIMARVSETENRNNISVLVHRIRRKTIGFCPFETVWGRGYRWAA